MLSLSEEKTVHLLRRLKTYNIVKSVKASDLQRSMTDLAEEDIAVTDNMDESAEYFYVFSFGS